MIYEKLPKHYIIKINSWNKYYEIDYIYRIYDIGQNDTFTFKTLKHGTINRPINHNSSGEFSFQ